VSLESTGTSKHWPQETLGFKKLWTPPDWKFWTLAAICWTNGLETASLDVATALSIETLIARI
jgi:hypothetical protein